MTRLLLRLLRITDFEPNESISVLKEQLKYEREKNKELTETLLSIIKPKAYEAPAQELHPIVQTSGIFSRRRAALEAKDRAEAQILKQAVHLGKPDDNLKDINDLETELGINEILEEEKTS